MSLLDLFPAYLRQAGRSENTIRAYRDTLRCFFEWWREYVAAPVSVAEITASHVQAYCDYLEEIGRKPSTVNRHIAALRSFFFWAKGRGCIAENPAENVRQVKTAPPARRALSRQEVCDLQRAAAVRRQVTAVYRKTGGLDDLALACRDEAILAIGLYAGLRVEEIVNLRLGDVEVGEQGGKVRVRGKGRRQRQVPLNLEARKRLRAWIDARPEGVDGDHFFVGRRGQLSARNVQQRIRELGRQAGIELTPRALRHTFASRLLHEAGADLVTTAALMGHESINTTATYVQPIEQDMAEAVERIS